MPSLFSSNSETLRSEAIDLIVERSLNEMSTRDLECFFRSTYSNMLEDYSDVKLSLKLEEVATLGELAEFKTLNEMMDLSDGDLFD
jgi:hypothetical protein